MTRPFATNHELNTFRNTKGEFIRVLARSSSSARFRRAKRSAARMTPGCQSRRHLGPDRAPPDVLLIVVEIDTTGTILADFLLCDNVIREKKLHIYPSPLYYLCDEFALAMSLEEDSF